jgi:2-succinyl-5-enolpyruvyl-6-hydroxy-3-cyclohexene-1-carboxylate synthase
VSKRLLQWLQQAVIRKYWMISPFDEPFDPVGQVTDRIVGSVTPICRALTEAVHPATSTSDLAWWQSREKATGEVLAEHLYSSDRLTGASVASRIAELTPANHGLFLASSLPVRLADWFAPSHGPRLQVAANRGASGIDGTVASAAGFAVGLQTPVTVLMGDQALLHDLNSLAMLNKIKYPVTVVVLNNGGGGIFDHLPIARHQSIFETYFVAAHEITFENAARQFGLGYSRPNSLDEFDKACSETLVAGKPAIIEVTTDRHTDLDQHRQILEAVKKRLARE